MLRPDEIALPRLPTLLRPHHSLHPCLDATRESRPERRSNLQENQSTTRKPANTNTSREPKLTADQRLGSSSRTTTSSI